MVFQDRLDYIKMDGTILTQEEIDRARVLRRLLLNRVLPQERLYEDEIELLFDYEFYTVEYFHSYDNSLFPILIDALYQFINPWTARHYLKMIHAIEQANTKFEQEYPEVISKEKELRLREMIGYYESELQRKETDQKFRFGTDDL